MRARDTSAEREEVERWGGNERRWRDHFSQFFPSHFLELRLYFLPQFFSYAVLYFIYSSFIFLLELCWLPFNLCFTYFSHSLSPNSLLSVAFFLFASSYPSLSTFLAFLHTSTLFCHIIQTFPSLLCFKPPRFSLSLSLALPCPAVASFHYTHSHVKFELTRQALLFLPTPPPAVIISKALMVQGIWFLSCHTLFSLYSLWVYWLTTVLTTLYLAPWLYFIF